MSALILALCVPSYANPMSGVPQAAAVTAPVVINQRPVPAARLQQLEQTYGLKIPLGSYWYDATSGLWGNWGAPPSGQLLPGFDYGPLPANASGGGTGVIINNRILHPSEVAWIAGIFGGAQPGRYWLDGYGNLGVEGQPLPFANLYAASAAAAPQQSGDGSTIYRSNATGTGIGTSGGSGYIMFDDGSGVSW